MTSLTGYSSENSVLHYTKAVALGLSSHENELLNLLHSKKTSLNSVMVMGCGCGREVFALEKTGHNVLGIDQSRELIASAKILAKSLNSPARFETAEVLSLDDRRKFDFVWLTLGLTGHFLGRESRVCFFKNLTKITNTVLYLPDVYPRPWSESFEQAHKKLMALDPKTEDGDTLRDRFAKDLKFEEPVKYHFFLSQKEAVTEFEDAGWTLEAYNEVGYIIKKTDLVESNY